MICQDFYQSNPLSVQNKTETLIIIVIYLYLSGFSPLAYSPILSIGTMSVFWCSEAAKNSKKWDTPSEKKIYSGTKMNCCENS